MRAQGLASGAIAAVNHAQSLQREAVPQYTMERALELMRKQAPRVAERQGRL